MLCSIAYFLARVTNSCCSVVKRGKAPPRIPSRADLVPGPKTTSPDWRRSYTGWVMYGCTFVSALGRDSTIRLLLKTFGALTGREKKFELYKGKTTHFRLGSYFVISYEKCIIAKTKPGARRLQVILPYAYTLLSS